MTRDLESALREAREEIAIQRCHYAVSAVAWERSGKIIDRIDAALSAASGEASGKDARPGTAPPSYGCDLCGANHPVGYVCPAPSEAPNVERDRIAELEAKISGLESLRPIWALGFSSASVSAQVTGVALASLWEKLSVDNQTKAVLALDALHARIAELEKERASARAEGIAAMRECAARIARDGCLVPPDGGSPTEDERLMCEAIAAAIREAKP